MAARLGSRGGIVVARFTSPEPRPLSSLSGRSWSKPVQATAWHVATTSFPHLRSRLELSELVSAGAGGREAESHLDFCKVSGDHECLLLYRLSLDRGRVLRSEPCESSTLTNLLGA